MQGSACDIMARGRRPGVALLEGIVALALLVLGIAIVGGQIRSGVRAISETEKLGRALTMTRSKLAELDCGLIEPQEEVEGNFGRVFPGHAWRISVLPTEIEDVFLVRLDILAGLLDAQWDEETPDEDEVQELATGEGGTGQEPPIMQTVCTLRITPATVDLKRDFGFTDDQLAQLASAAGDAGDLLGFDPTQPFDPAALMKLPLEDLLDLLPMLLQAFGSQWGGRFAGLANLSRDDLEQALRSTGTDNADQGSGEEADTGSSGGKRPNAAGTEEGGRGTGRSPESPPTVDDLQELLRKRDRGRR